MQQNIANAQNASFVVGHLLQELAKERKETMIAKQWRNDMTAFLKRQLIKTIRSKMNMYFSSRVWNRFCMYEVCQTPAMCYQALTEELSPYGLPPKVAKPYAVDETKMFQISSKDEFHKFFGTNIDGFVKRVRNGGQLCLLLPIIICYRPGMEKVFIGIKKVPKYGKTIGHLVRYEFKRSTKKVAAK